MTESRYLPRKFENKKHRLLPLIIGVILSSMLLGCVGGDDDAFCAFLDNYADRFVNEYASTNHGEDIAESFARFVLLNAPTANQIKDQKVKFFYDLQELAAIRNQIRAGVDFDFDINQIGPARLERSRASSSIF